MEKHATALIHGTVNRAPRATVEYDADPTSIAPVCLMVSNDTTITETQLTCEEATTLAAGLLAAVQCVESPSTEPGPEVTAIEETASLELKSAPTSSVKS